MPLSIKDKAVSKISRLNLGYAITAMLAKQKIKVSAQKAVTNAIFKSFSIIFILVQFPSSIFTVIKLYSEIIDGRALFTRL